MNNFEEKMTERSDAELIEITTTHRVDYQPEAVVAAELELKKRNLTSIQLTEAYEQLAKKQKILDNKKEKMQNLQKKVTDISETLHPLKEKSTDKTIKLITVGLSIPFLIFLYGSYDLLLMIFQNLNEIDFSVILYIIPIILFPIGLFGFWSFKKFGWIILTILITAFSLNTIISLINEIKWASYHYDSPASDSIYFRSNNAIYFGQLVLFLGLLFYLNKKIVIEKFKIKKWIQLLVILLTAIPVIFLGLSILL